MHLLISFIKMKEFICHVQWILIYSPLFMKKDSPTYHLNICLKIPDQNLQLKHIKTRHNSSVKRALPLNLDLYMASSKSMTLTSTCTSLARREKVHILDQYLANWIDIKRPTHMGKSILIFKGQ